MSKLKTFIKYLLVVFFSISQVWCALECGFCRDQYQTPWSFTAKFCDQNNLCKVCSLLRLNMRTIVYTIQAKKFISEIFLSSENISMAIDCQAFLEACKVTEFFTLEFENIYLKTRDEKKIVVSADKIAEIFISEMVVNSRSHCNDKRIPCCIKINSKIELARIQKITTYFPDTIILNRYYFSLPSSQVFMTGFAFLKSAPGLIEKINLARKSLSIDGRQISFLDFLFFDKISRAFNSPSAPVAQRQASDYLSRPKPDVSRQPTDSFVVGGISSDEDGR